MLRDVLPYLHCPHCTGALDERGGTLRCANGHAFDVARQGYVSLFAGGGATAPGDTAAMVDARERFLRAGHMEPLGAALVEAADGAAGCVVDVGAGTGWHLARLVARNDGRVGLALDSSKYALRRAARAHPRIGAAACDAWRAVPVRDDAAALVLSVFAPRDGAEIARILRPDGMLVAVTPTPRHLAELVDALDLLTVDADKPERLDEKLAPDLERIDRRTLDWDLALTRADAHAAAAMGPTAWHAHAAALEKKAADLPEPLTATASVTISTYRQAAPSR